MNITEYGRLCPIDYNDGWAIHYLSETDLYKYNMGLVMFLKFPHLCGTYIFKCRNGGVKFDKGVLAEINRQLDHLCHLRYTKPELDYLKSLFNICSTVKVDIFIPFLSNFIPYTL